MPFRNGALPQTRHVTNPYLSQFLLTHTSSRLVWDAKESSWASTFWSPTSRLDRILKQPPTGRGQTLIPDAGFVQNPLTERSWVGRGRGECCVNPDPDRGEQRFRISSECDRSWRERIISGRWSLRSSDYPETLSRFVIPRSRHEGGGRDCRCFSVDPEGRSHTCVGGGKRPLLSILPCLPAARSTHFRSHSLSWESGFEHRIRVSNATTAAQSAELSKAMAPMDSPTLLEEKKRCRTVVRKELRQLPVQQRMEEDVAVIGNLIDSELLQNSRVIGAYLSCAALREVDTLKLVTYILQQQKALYVPRVDDKKSHMRMLRITDMEGDVERNAMDILEPKEVNTDGSPRDELMQADQPLDLLLVPGLAFDRHGGRLGRGGGYYDWFISTYRTYVESKGWKMPPMVALSYSVQLRSTPIPMGEADRHVDGIAMKDGIFHVPNRALDANTTTNTSKTIKADEPTITRT
ncbi:hypothetical protein CBR_g34194 [Chara braunii]|uniref:5-formyltetrahydrofolate cyclo-ligase n=1 Tax=Chara braunii TaxID=69332 RepID=A0A388LI57_CHABU|nr:hypothetical protein CBR_g34194 [Chara braunii]|eukprot:GBG82014.1 hypothetical protein CBR_g34194 [Chara braunii]